MYELIDIIHLLVGKTYPSGDSSTDAKRIKKLDALLDLHYDLTDYLIEVATFKWQPLGSMREIGEKADGYLYLMEERIRRRGKRWED
jgi:hypothetical protein